MATKRTEYLIDIFKLVVEDEEANETDKESCLKKLFVYDPDYAKTELEKYVERRRPWAVAMALKIEKDKNAVVGGVGVMIDE